MVVQALTGLLFPSAYRDVEWIRAAWFGNDGFTLLVAAPLLYAGWVFAGRGSTRGLVLWLGIAAYAVYNYAFYLFGAALNAFFPLYVAAFVVASLLLIVCLPRVDASHVSEDLLPAAPVRLIGGSLVFLGAGLASVWVAMWAAYVFGGRPTPVEPETFKLVAAVDLSMIVPVLVAGGILMWRRGPWGVIVAGIASIQGTLYLCVLSLNSFVAIRRGLADAPGELLIWGPLTAFSTSIVVVLFANIRDRRPNEQRERDYE
jgi:hypothetical protein